MLNEPQLKTLRWIGDGCPDGVMHDDTHRISAAALRNRDLIRIHGRGKTWRAELTEKGRAYLELPPVVAGKRELRRAPQQTRPNPPPERAPASTEPTRSDPIPGDLRGAHQLIRATRSAASRLKPDTDGLLAIGPRAGVVYMKVSRAQLHRSLVLAHGLITAARKRGWEVAPYARSKYGQRPGVAVVIREHRYPIEITEETAAVPFTDREIERWRARSVWTFDDRRDKQARGSRRDYRLRVHEAPGASGQWPDGRGLLAREPHLR